MDTPKKPATKGGRRRAVHFVLREDDCPGLIEFLDSLENRMESKTVRAILFKWFEERQKEGTVDLIGAAVRTVHDHDLAVLQRKVQPHVGTRMSVVDGAERKPLLVPAALPPNSPPASPGLVLGGATVNAGSVPGDVTETPYVVPDRTQKVPEEKVTPARDEPVVGFLDTMFGLNDG